MGGHVAGAYEEEMKMMAAVLLGVEEDDDRLC